MTFQPCIGQLEFYKDNLGKQLHYNPVQYERQEVKLLWVVLKEPKI